MNIKKLLCLMTVVTFGSTAAASAQGLVDAAKAEKQRRAKMRTPARVYTEADRSGSTPEPAITPADPNAPPPLPAPPGSKKKEKTPDELAAEKQQEWADRVKKTQDEITSLQTAISGNETTLASTFNITPARAALANKIDADKKHLAELQQQLVNLEDERRRSGLTRR
ncbi:MAG: hypothetical protein ABI672_14010 [Vicinamibacteria bacterium]